MAEYQKFVWVDIDGTLAQYDGWKGIDHIGDPFPGAADFMNALTVMGEKLGFKVGIFTTRTKVGMPGRKELEVDEVKYAEALANIIHEWLKKHEILYDTVYVGQGKPPGLAYIDDRAAWCDPRVLGANAYPTALEAVRNLVTKAF